MRWTTTLCLGVALAGCIESGGRTASGDPEGSGGAGGSGTGADARPDDHDGIFVADAQAAPDFGEIILPPDGGTAGGAVAPPDAGEVPVEELCADVCARVDECFPAACPPLSATPSSGGFCDFCGMLAPEEARKLAAASCDEVVAAVFDARPRARDFCAGEGPPPVDERCVAACDRLRECETGIDGCERFCNQVPDQILECVLTTEACEELQGCFGMGPGPGPEQVCGNICARTGNCIQGACAPGTVGPAWFQGCMESCGANPPGQEELQAFFQSTCQDIVAEARAADPALDTRCEATPEEACATLCADRIEPCGADLAPGGCVEACAGFSDANLRCVQNAPECEQVLGCFGDPEGEARCERACERIETCLLEACPPRVIPPDLSFRCTAGCLPDPPAEEEVQQVEAGTCAEVRQIVYRNNRELAPVCEGGRDFRPTADECAAFCDNGLQACLGVGGREFCLAGCASLTREQYVCALEAQGVCEVINACLSAD